MKIAFIFSFFFVFSFSAYSQNTKGDKPVSNQRQVRESKGKVRAQKGNKKPKTKDISGRRLRTKDKSSANRANVGIKQPDPYQGRKRTQSDKAAKSQGRIVSEPPREQSQRAWSGDISGKPIRRIKPSKSGVARNNVYPQKGPFVNYGLPKSKKDKPKVYTKTVSGDYPINITPQNKQHAWKGNIKGGPVGTPSRSGQIKNTYKQFGQYQNHPSRKPQNSDRIQSGRIGSPRTLRSSSSPWPKKKKNVNLSSGSRSFVTRVKKNVYWGKITKSGKPVTTDITGRPLVKRNFRSSPAGLISRDTLRTFGRKPGGDRASKRAGGGFDRSGKRQNAWAGDISGKKLRGTKPRTTESVGEFFFPRKLSISSSGEVGKPLPGSGIRLANRKQRKVETNSLPPRSPGIGGSSYGKHLGNIKGRRTIKGGASASGKGWNNNGEPIDVNGAGAGTIRGSKFQGNYKRGELGPGFSSQGAGWKGNVKQGSAGPGFSSQGAGWQGNVKRGLAGPGFSSQGAGWKGNVKRGSVGPGFSSQGAGWQGNVKRGLAGPGFTSQGAGWKGNLKGRKPLKGGGSVSGKLWNNGGEAIDVNGAGSGTIRASKFQGNNKIGVLDPGGFSSDGANWKGSMKGKKPIKGGGSVSGKLWNNNEQAIDVNGAGSGTIRAAKFQGNMKTAKPEKGGGSVSGKLWNNNEQAIDVNGAGSGTIRAAKFQGNMKTRKPEKGGGSVSGKLWNNNEQPLPEARMGTRDAGEFQGRTKEGNLVKRAYVQNPNASKESIKKQRPDETTYAVTGLQVKVKERDYKDKPKAADGSLKGIAPYKSSVKASEYARGVKKYWENKHNPNSADDALKVFYPGKAIAQFGDYQGNTKMHKYKDNRLHPDSKFAHSFRDNVKEERTFLMNVKLFWSKVFRKSETQPEHLKEKIRKPRYDKGEEGMWYN